MATTFKNATVTVEGGAAGSSSIKVDGTRVPLTAEGIKQAGVEKVKEAVAAALRLPDGE